MNENPGFYTWIDSLRTVRSPHRWVGGVVAGIADRIGMDHTLGRALFVVLTLLTSGLTVLFYGLAWMFLPEPDGRVHTREAGQGRWSAGMTGALIFTVLGIGNLVSVPGQIGRGESFWTFGGVVGLAVIGFFVWLVASKGGQGLQGGQDHLATQPQSGTPAGDPAGDPTGTPPTEPVYLAPSDTGWYSSGAGSTSATPSATPTPEGPEPMSATASYPTQPTPSAAYRPADNTPPVPPADRTPPSLSGASQLIVIGLAILAGAAVSLLRYLEVFTASWPVIWAASLATTLGVMAIGLIVGAIAGRGGGGLTVTSAILAVPVIGATGGAFVQDGPWGTFWTENGSWEGGVVTGSPTEGYQLSFGEGTINLAGLEGTSAAAADPVVVDLSFSTADLVVPNNVDVYLDVDNSFSSLSGPNLGTDDAGHLQVVDVPGDDQVLVAVDLSFSTLNVRAEEPMTAPATDNGANTDTTQE